MPRRKDDRPRQTFQDVFAKRMEEEQRAQGMSDAGLAQRASVHYPISANQIWQIKHRTPRRKIDIDEALAITQALGLRQIEDLVYDAPMTAFVRYMDSVPMPTQREVADRIQEIEGYMDELEIRGLRVAVADRRDDTEPERWAIDGLHEYASLLEKSAAELSALSRRAKSIATKVKKAAAAARKEGEQ